MGGVAGRPRTIQGVGSWGAPLTPTLSPRGERGKSRGTTLSESWGFLAPLSLRSRPAGRGAGGEGSVAQDLQPSRVLIRVLAQKIRGLTPPADISNIMAQAADFHEVGGTSLAACS